MKNFLENIIELSNQPWFDLAWKVLGLLFFSILGLYEITKRSKKIFGWKSTVKKVNDLADFLEKKRFIPDIIIGNSILANLLDEHFRLCVSIPVVEINKVEFELQKDYIDKGFLCIRTNMWYHLVSKESLNLVMNCHQNPKILILVNYVNQGIYFRQLKELIQEYTHLSESNFKIATLFTNDNFIRETPIEDTESGITGDELVVDYKGQIIKSWKRIYMPWGNVSKRQRHIENDKVGYSYLKEKFKLRYYLKVNPPKSWPFKSINEKRDANRQ